ncbi:MAG: hypothetical protein V4591_03105 [Bdellovibrionota bacterium]
MCCCSGTFLTKFFSGKEKIKGPSLKETLNEKKNCFRWFCCVKNTEEISNVNNVEIPIAAELLEKNKALLRHCNSYLKADSELQSMLTQQRGSRTLDASFLPMSQGEEKRDVLEIRISRKKEQMASFITAIVKLNISPETNSLISLSQEEQKNMLANLSKKKNIESLFEAKSDQAEPSRAQEIQPSAAKASREKANISIKGSASFPGTTNIYAAGNASTPTETTPLLGDQE